MLVGRDRERRRIQALLAAARVGAGAALVLSGEAGIGKTALLDDAAASATGLHLLRATGTEPEIEVSFGGLLQVLRPALAHLDRIPPPQAEALGSALALRPGIGVDRFAVGAATLSLLSRFAEDQPVAVLVDDAHLLDRPSAQALTFAARRLTVDPVVLLAAVRPGVPGPLTEAGLPVLPVGGLSPTDASELVTATGRRLGAGAAARLYEATGGNPLALLELSDDATALDALPPSAPLPVPASLARAFARRADRLSEPARAALLVAATGGSDLGPIGRACQTLGVPIEALEEAEDAGLLTLVAGGVAFRHNLVRSAVYSEAPPATRRAVHRALAEALARDDVDRSTWHLGEAALGRDEDTARMLESAASRARDRGAHAVAAATFDRAARLTPDPDQRVHRLVAAAEAAWRAGMGDEASGLLARAAELRQPPALRARAAALRGTISARTGAAETGRDVLMAAGAESADADPDTAIRMLGDAVLACFFLGDAATIVDASRRIDELVRRADTEAARWVGDMACGMAGVLTGHGGPERLRRAVRQVVPGGPLLGDPSLAPWLVLGPLFLRESTTGRELVQTVVEDLRRRSDVGGLPFLLFQVARDQATRDRWDLAEVSYTEGIALAREAGHTSDLAACLAGLAWLQARQGRDTECREHADEALRICTSRHLQLFQVWSLFAHGDLDLARGRLDQAVGRFQHLALLLDDLGVYDVDLSPAPELVDALVRLDRRDEAREMADSYAARATAKGQPWALARSARASALLCPDSAIDEQFGLALAHNARTLDVFERARTHLDHGARLRRARRRADARVPLRAALTTFEALGAVPWADQAAGELRATGEIAHRRGASALRDLTPQEVQIARMLAEGRTTRETAAALFLSPKTVEYHLRHVYIKLGVNSRAELVDSLATPS
ncbi:ATP-binding protein [Geodermatophilus chilensis]|jgi:DNA-binding CsgD family transcriptional regulator|uniref:ATP-binding protein n=1 Tax=Geodermatophilus chilensis TaxID=2035835 RepID=UPI000C25DD0B|nr:helix-turn-helix transcriptional regulator [Geodermatophilus chilensis]